VRPYHDQDWNLHAEASGQHVFHPNLNTSGVPGVSQQTISLADEPELRIAFDQLVDTGPISASSANAYGGGVGANWRNFLMQGEFCQIDVNQSKLQHVPAPMLGFNGGYVEGSVVSTSEDPLRQRYYKRDESDQNGCHHLPYFSVFQTESPTLRPPQPWATIPSVHACHTHGADCATAGA
jgi:hypothetical protein